MDRSRDVLERLAARVVIAANLDARLVCRSMGVLQRLLGSRVAHQLFPFTDGNLLLIRLRRTTFL